MNKRKTWRCLAGGVLLLLLLLFQSGTVAAAGAAEEAEIGIMYEEADGNVEVPPPTKEPDVELVANKPAGQLPALGQAIASLILLLIGTACLIVCVGVLGLRKVYLIQL